MEEAGFRVIFCKHFDRPTQLKGENGIKNWIEMFAKGMFNGVDQNTKNCITTKVESNLKELLYQNGNWVADYKRIRVIGIKQV